MTNVTVLLLASFVMIFTHHLYFLVFYKKDLFKERRSLAEESYFNKIIVTLVTKVCRLLFASVLLRKLPIISVTMRVDSRSLCCIVAPYF